MFVKTIIFFGILRLSQCQNECSQYFQYAKDNGDVQGLIRLTPESAKEHRLRVQLTVTRQISVSKVLVENYKILLEYLLSCISYVA